MNIRSDNMHETSLKAIDKLLYTEDIYTENYRKQSTLIFYENSTDQPISLATTAYLEKKLKHQNSNIALGIAKTPNFDILALEMDISDNDRVAVSISDMGAIYGLWFKKDNVYINSTLSVGASFRESVVLVGLLIEASLLFRKDAHFNNLYNELKAKINTNEDLTELLVEFGNTLREVTASFVWLNNSGDISYRELYIHSLPYTSLVSEIYDGYDNFILFPTKR